MEEYAGTLDELVWSKKYKLVILIMPIVFIMLTNGSCSVIICDYGEHKAE